MKRFFLVDTFTGRNKTYRTHSHPYASDDYLEKYSYIRYIRRMEFLFELQENHHGNEVPVPLLIIEYATINMQDYRNSNDLRAAFKIRITFRKEFTLNIYFHVSSSRC